MNGAIFGIRDVTFSRAGSSLTLAEVRALLRCSEQNKRPARNLDEAMKDRAAREQSDMYDSIKDSYPKYVVSMVETDFSLNGITHKNIRTFLRSEEF